MMDPRQLTTGALTPFAFVVDEYAQCAFLDAVQDCHLRYVLRRDNRPPLVHPGLLLDNSSPWRSPALGGCDWLHLREETRFCALAHLGEPLQSRWHLTGTDNSAGQQVTTVTAVVSGAGGRTVLRRTSWGRRTRDQSAVAGEAAGAHGPAASEAVRRQTAADGSRFSTGTRQSTHRLRGHAKLATADRLGLYFGSSQRRLPAATTAASPEVSATHTMAHLCELMVDHFGEAWLATGALSIDLHAPIRAGDRLTPTATLIGGPDETEARPRCRVHLELADHRRNVIADGTAEAVW